MLRKLLKFVILQIPSVDNHILVQIHMHYFKKLMFIQRLFCLKKNTENLDCVYGRSTDLIEGTLDITLKSVHCFVRWLQDVIILFKTVKRCYWENIDQLFLRFTEVRISQL